MTQQEQTSEGNQPMPTTRILLVEDNPGDARLIHEMTRGVQDVELESVDRLATALKKLSTGHFKAVLLDLSLPDSQGLETINVVRSEHPGVPIVVLTGRDDNELAVQALQLGAQDYLVKGEVTSNPLVRSLRYAVERTRLQEAAKRERKRAEEYLRVSGSLMIAVGADERVMLINKRGCEVLGRSEAEIVGANWIENYIPKHLQPEVRAVLRSICAGELAATERYENPILTASGEERLIVWQNTVFRGPNGEILGALASGEDVTDRRRAQEELSEAEHRLKLVFDLVQSGVLFIDAETHKILDVNPAALELIGAPKSQVVGRSCHEYVCPAQAGKCPITDLGKQVDRAERVLIDANGREIPVIKSVAVVQSGGKRQLLESFLDIRAQKGAEVALRESMQEYQRLLDLAQEGIWALNTKGETTYANPRMARMLGREPDELKEAPVFQFLPETQHEAIRQILTSKRPREVQALQLLKRSGKLVYATFSSSPVRNASGEMTGVLAVVMDVTEQKQLEDQLMQSEKLDAIGRLAAGIAHEINTPTQYVSDNTQFLADSLGDLTELIKAADRLREAVESGGDTLAAAKEVRKIAEEADVEYLLEEIPKALTQSKEGLGRVAKLVGAMKEFSHPSEQEKALADVNHLLETTATVARNEWKYVADLDLQLAPDLPHLPCLSDRLNQVFLNIIVNAAHAITDVIGRNAGQKGRITIRTRVEGDRIRIEIADTGGGIPESVRPHIFEPFYTTKGVGKGTGQGLAIARSVVVDQHGGTIEVDTSAGEGTTFIILLPLQDDPVETQPASMKQAKG